MFKRYVNIYCTRFFTNALCASLVQKQIDCHFFAQMWPKHTHSDQCNCPINVYSVTVCLNLIKLAAHIQAHSEPCRAVRTEMLQRMSTSAGRSYAQGTYMQVELSSPYQAQDFMDDRIGKCLAPSLSSYQSGYMITCSVQ